MTDVRFEGNLSFTEDQLKTNVQTKDSWLLAPKPLQIDIVDDDVASLGQWPHRNMGYLDVVAWIGWSHPAPTRAKPSSRSWSMKGRRTRCGRRV